MEGPSSHHFSHNFLNTLHYKKITVLQRIFLLQIRCKPIKIRCKSLLATDLQQKCSVAKNLVAILHTLAFGCKRPTDLQQNYFVVILQRISHPLQIPLLNPKNQKTMNKLKLLSFRCKVATDQHPFHYKPLQFLLAIPLQLCNRFATTMSRCKLCCCNSIAIPLQICNRLATVSLLTIAISVAIPLQLCNRFATTISCCKICCCNSIAIPLQIRNSIATNIFFLNLT